MEKQIILSGLSLEELRQLIVDVFKEREDLRQDAEKIKHADNVYLTRKEVARMLKISLPTLHEYVQHELIIAHRIGRRILFTAEDVRKALKAISYKRR
jgi:excisionase family DNA binding protein